MRPRLRRAIAGMGVACLTLSALSLTVQGVLLADPLLAVRLHLPMGSSTLAVSEPVPSPSPSPEPRKRRFLGDGPIVLRGDGTYQLGLSRSNRNGLPLDYDEYATALTITAERRTEQSSLSITDALGYGAGSAAGGTLIVGYQTPKYGLTYGQLAGPADTQLQIGGLARGLGLTFPMKNGELTYLAATATQQDDVTYRVYGMRRDWTGLGGYLSAAGYLGNAEGDSGREGIADFSFRRYGPKLSTQTELAFSSTRDVVQTPDGVRMAAAFQADLQGATTMSTLDLRYDPAGFQSLSGPIDGGLSADLAVRSHTNAFGDVGIDLAHIDDRIYDDVQHDDHLTLSGGRSWTHFGFQYVAGIDDTRTNDTVSIQRTAALTLTESFSKLSLFETLQSSAVSSSTGAASQSQVTFGASHPFLGGSGAYQIARSMAVGGFTSAGSGLVQTLSYRRNVGRKADATISESVESSVNNGVPSRLIDTGISGVRRLSSVVALQVGLDRYRQTGLGAGKGMAFNASLVGPFGFGQPQGGYGRANPKLPAVIRGTVSFSTSPTPFAYNQPTIRGFNNALVILDGGISQRTDSTGTFEFHFVTQGTHTIRVDPATLPPGLVLDREYQSFAVQGGQTMTVQFNVGNFAGVAGSVMAADNSGAKHPLGNVGIAVDGIQAVSTTSDGHYQIGRLSPGAHTIAIVDATVPSTVAFVGDTKRTVTVTPGTQTPLDFVATTLGSIGGFVMAPSDGAFGTPVGLKNVYVVAEPGDHAGITDDDGSYLLDNLPPGTYTINVDPDTIPDGLSVLSGPDAPIALAGGASVGGMVFHLGAGTKNVVYTFDDGKKQLPIQVSTEPAVAPPGAQIKIVARTGGKNVKALAVESDVLGGLALRFDRASNAWTGTLVVPALAKGDYAFTVTAHRNDVAEGTALVSVDPRLPLYTVRLYPAKPEPGHTVKVSLKTLAPIEAGDALLFEDGYKIVLPKPNGRLFVFDIRVWQRGLPYSATIITKHGQTYPLSLR